MEDEKQATEWDGAEDWLEVEEDEKWRRIAGNWLKAESIEIRFYPMALSEEEIDAIMTGKIKSLKCRKCNCWFTNRRELMRHIWQVHRRKKEVD